MGARFERAKTYVHVKTTCWFPMLKSHSLTTRTTHRYLWLIWYRLRSRRLSGQWAEDTRYYDFATKHNCRSFAAIRNGTLRNGVQKVEMNTSKAWCGSILIFFPFIARICLCSVFQIPLSEPHWSVLHYLVNSSFVIASIHAATSKNSWPIASIIRVLPPVLEKGIFRKEFVQELNILLWILREPRRVNDIHGLLGLKLHPPLARKFFPRPLLDFGEVPTGMCGSQTREYTFSSRDIDVEWNGRHVSMAH